MQKYLPGSTFVVKNMPGAGHLVGANAIYASKADGLTIGTFNTGLIYTQLIKLDGAKFDLEQDVLDRQGGDRAARASRSRRIRRSRPSRICARRKEPVNFATSGGGSADFVETTCLPMCSS